MHVTCYFYASSLKIHSQVTTSEAIDDFHERVRASIVRESCLDVLIALIRVIWFLADVHAAFLVFIHGT